MIDLWIYVPDIACNLISVPKLARKGIISIFQKNVAKLIHKQPNKVIGYAERVGESYILRLLQPPQSNVVQANPMRTDSCTWDRRLGHLHKDAIRQVMDAAKGMKITHITA